MKLTKPVGLSDFTLERVMTIGGTLCTLVHYDRETLEFSFERLLSHVNSNCFGEVFVLTKDQVEDKLHEIYFLPEEVV